MFWVYWAPTPGGLTFTLNIIMLFFVLWSLTFLWKDKLFANTNTTLFTNMICYPQIQNSMICTNRCISVNVFNL